MNNKILSILLSVCLLVAIAVPASAQTEKDKTIEIQRTINSVQAKTFTPATEISQNGKKYKYIETKSVEKENPKEITVQVKNLKHKKYTPENTYKDDSGTSYVFKDINFESTDVKKKQSADKTIHKTKILKGQSADFPESVKVTVPKIDDKTKSVEGNIGITNVTRSDYYWITGEPIKGTVYGYDSESYCFDNSDIEIPNNKDYPQYKGFENTILKQAGRNSSNSKIISAVWDGKAYIKSGVKCRNALFRTQIAVYDMTASYRGEITYDVKEYTANVIYTTENTVSQNVTVTMVYEEIKTISPVIIGISVAGGILAISALTAGILFLIKKKHGKKEENY